MNAVSLYCRHVFQERLVRVFVPGTQVLDLGGGTGEDARLLASCGVRIASLGAALAGAPPIPLFDGAYAGLGALDQADLAEVGRVLVRCLRPEAPVLLGLTRRSHPRPRRVRALLGPGLCWRKGFALGVLIPGASRATWAERHPQAFGLLAILERIVRGWPPLRSSGMYLVVEAVRGR